MAFDIQVVAQTIVYFAICFLNFVVAIPLGVTMIEFHGQCILFNKFTWTSSSHIADTFSSTANCTFAIYVPVVLIFYSLIMGIYYTFKTCSSMNPNYGYEMWVIPIIASNLIIVVLMLVVCCLISAGLKMSCDSFLESQKHHNLITKCDGIEAITWDDKKIDGSHFYSYPYVSQVAGWITFFMWITQLALSIVRFARNRRRRPIDLVVNSPTVVSTDTPANVNRY